MAIDWEEFKRFTPRRRITELQGLIDSLKGEIEEKQKEIQEAERLQAYADREARAIEQVEVPEARAAPARKRAKAIEDIPAEEEKTEEKRITRAEQLELEKLLATAPLRTEKTIHEIAHRDSAEIYNALRNIYQRGQETGVETKEDREQIYAIRRGLEKKKEEGYKAPSEKAKHLQTAAEQMAESMYQNAAGSYKR